jgi:tetratricopeptide (TPR) repeat protein
MQKSDADLESLLAHAKESEKECDWRAAAEAYSSASALVPSNDLLQLGNVEEARAHALYRYAFQAETKEEFREHIAKAIEQYAVANEAYGKLGGRESVPWSRRCDAMTAFLGFWSEAGFAERKRLISEAWSLAKSAADAFEEVKDYPQLRKTNNVLTSAVSIGWFYTTDFKSKENLIREALEYSEKALKSLSGGGDEADIARAYVNAAYYTKTFCSNCMGIDGREEWDKKAGELLRKGLELSKEGSLDVLSFNYVLGGLPSSLTQEELDGLCGEAFEYATRTNDRLRMGMVFEWMGNRAFVKAHEAIDSDGRASSSKEALDHTEKAGRCFSIFPFVHATDAVLWVGAPYAGYCALMASLEPDLKTKREFALKGVGAFEAALRAAEDCGYQAQVTELHWLAARILVNLARTEKSPEEKKQVLERATGHAEQFLSQWQVQYPMDNDTLGITALMADIEHELADLETDAMDKISLCRRAISHMSEAYENLRLEANSSAGSIERWIRLHLGVYQQRVADWSLQLYELSKEKGDLVNAADAFQKAVEHHRVAGQPARMAESYWKAAQVQDALGDYPGASQRFVDASGSYKQAAEAMPRLSNLYQDYDFYMQAWSQIELARYHHTRQEARAASECYEKASNLHESTEKWRFLAPNYRAWAEVENGEDLSRNEKSKGAMAAFKNASKLFGDTKESLSRQLKKIDGQDERENVTRLVKAADLRREYCQGRLALEEAKILDKQGDEFGSCERFGSAADTFERLHRVLESDLDRRETELIMVLSRAWQTMARAETEASPELYEHAAQIFGQAKDLSIGEKAKLLAMGHGRFCRALAAGTKFADTGDPSLHAVATRNLESAAKHYLKAGLENDSEYARASKLLFDAYVYMDRASREEDQARKARLYAMTEKVLETSASSYSKAEYPKKKDRVLKLLEKVKGERELAATLTEVLQAPDVMASTMALPTLTPTHETAAGMQRFEHADVQATLFAGPKDLQVGQDLSIEIELVNAGRGAAQLTKVDRIIPEGFNVVTGPERCRIEDSYLNMRGRRLDALKTEDVKLVIKPTAQGEFKLKPRVMYLDESGKYKSCEPEPVMVRVKELGISGWLKGPDARR